MKTVNVKCPVCRQRGQLNPDALVAEHECPNCRQIVRLIPENSTVRAVKFCLMAIPLVLIILWAIGVILNKLNY